MKTLRRWWEKWLRWPYTVATITALAAGGITQITWLVILSWSMLSVSLIISIAYAVVIGRMLRAARRRKAEADARVRAIIARRARERT